MVTVMQKFPPAPESVELGEHKDFLGAVLKFSGLTLRQSFEELHT